MFLVSTRNFPPEIGGIQNLMEGLSNALLNHGPVKVFADDYKNSENYDENSKLNIQRISGFKIFRKYRKANLVKDFIKNNETRAIFFDHWKSIENIDRSILKKTKSFCLIFLTNQYQQFLSLKEFRFCHIQNLVFLNNDLELYSLEKYQMQ